jgi:hypothetical protein
MFSLITIFFVSTFAFGQTNTDVKSTVEKFYKFYRTRNGVVGTHELNYLKPWFTRDLTKLFQTEIKREAEYIKKNHDDKPHFGDGFPFNPYEECVVKNNVILNIIKVGEPKIDVTEAIVEVTFTQPKECGEAEIDIYQIELSKYGKRWLIKDWIYSDGKRLTDDLKRKDY